MCQNLSGFEACKIQKSRVNIVNNNYLIRCKRGAKVVRAQFIVMLSILISITACSVSPPIVKPNSTPVAKAAPVNDSYKIGVDDHVQVSVWRNPDLSITAPVRPDGKISVPLIGDVQAGGLAPEEVATDIEKKLTYYIRDPKVAVIVSELRSHEFLTRVRVTGAVRTPKTLQYRQGMTVLDAVLEAGSVNEFAAPNRTKVHRKFDLKADSKADAKFEGKDKKTKVIPIKLGDILTDGNLSTNIELSPGDVVTVPERLF